MKINKQFILLFILVFAIVPLLNIKCTTSEGKFYNPMDYPLKTHKQLLSFYEENYGGWNWEKRYNVAQLIELNAVTGGIEFSWLDLPTEEIHVFDTPGGNGGHHH